MTGIPSLKENIACQQLITFSDCKTSSWLRKQSFRNKAKIFKWPQVFVVLCDGCVYYYRNETAKTPSGAFSLYGYNWVGRAADIPDSEAPWAFKIVHTFKEYKTYLFSASSEVEMKDWMKYIKKELKYANNQNMRSAGDGQDGPDEGSDSSQTYQEIESKIYDDPGQLMLPTNYKNRKNDDFTDDDDIYRCRGPVAPPVPPREGSGIGPRAKRGATIVTPDVGSLTQKLEKKLDLSKQSSSVTDDYGKVNKEKKTSEPKGRQRGSPDGASIKREAIEQSHQASSIDEEDEETDPEKYWAAIHFFGTDKSKSSDIIRTLGEDGVYLVRDGGDGGEKVLVVYTGDVVRKFRILWENEESFLHNNPKVRRPTLEELLLYYYDHDLPGKSEVTLSHPYQLHPMFKKSMLD